MIAKYRAWCQRRVEAIAKDELTCAMWVTTVGLVLLADVIDFVGSFK